MASEKSGPDLQDRYSQLTILDGKCGALLQLSALILTLGTIAIPTVGVPLKIPIRAIAIALIFLLVSLLSLFVIWVDWNAAESVVRVRTSIYKPSVLLTAAGLLLIGWVVIDLALIGP